MRRFLFGCVMLAIASTLPSVAQADPQQDKQIAQTAIQRLDAEKKAGRLKGFSIDLQSENGTLWLSGRVSDKAQQDAALDVARRVPGVKQVVNDLTIAPPPAAKTPATTFVANTKTVGSGVTPAAAAAPVRQMAPAPMQSVVQPQPQRYASQRPVAMAPSNVAMANYQGQMVAQQPNYAPSIPMGAQPARYDTPAMPGYSWPSYASHPNYAAVTYPKQYSASAWPYVGPFYPYPQVPLGWRKVTLEWDDGWWFVDFKDRHHH